MSEAGNIVHSFSLFFDLFDSYRFLLIHHPLSSSHPHQVGFGAGAAVLFHWIPTGTSVGKGILLLPERGGLRCSCKRHPSCVSPSPHTCCRDGCLPPFRSVDLLSIFPSPIWNQSIDQLSPFSLTTRMSLETSSQRIYYLCPFITPLHVLVRGLVRNSKMT